MSESRLTLKEAYYHFNPSGETKMRLGLARLQKMGGWYQDYHGMEKDGIDSSEIVHAIRPDGTFEPRWGDNKSIYVDHQP